MTDKHHMPPKPRFNPEFSWGTIFTLITVMAGGASVWIGLNLKVASAMERIEAIDQRQTRQEDRVDRRMSEIHSDVQDIKRILMGEYRDNRRNQ